MIIERNAIVGMKLEILSLATLDDEVREQIDMMSLRELGLWIHHNDKRLKEAEAKEEEAKRATCEKRKAKEVQAKAEYDASFRKARETY